MVRPKVAHPDRAVVSLTGDGGFGWSMQELSTAAQHGIGLVTVVMNDGAYGNVQRTQRESFAGRLIGTDLHNPDYVRLAEAFGVAGIRAESPQALEGVLRDALAAGAPCLIEAPVGPMPSPWHLLDSRPATAADGIARSA